MAGTCARPSSTPATRSAATLIDARAQRGQRVITYGAADADIAATGVAMTAIAGMTIAMSHAAGPGDAVARALAGAFNAQNLLGVLGVLLASDVALDRRARRARAP